MGGVVRTVGKIAGVIAGIAAIGTGIGAVLGGTMVLSILGGTVAASAIAAGAGLVAGVAGMIAGTPEIPQSATQLGRLQARLDARAARKLVLGHTAMPADIRYYEGSGEDEEFVDYIIAVAAHRVGSIDEIWFEDALAWTATGGVQGEYVGYLTAVTVRLEGSASNTIAINGGTRWGSDDRLTGCAYLRLRIKRTGNSDEEQSPLVSGLPGRVTIVGNGMPMYDPRFDSTVGGVGPMRVDDQSTWGPSSGNLIIQALNVLLGWRINGKLSVGGGLPAKFIDMDSVITCANICDEDIALSGGGTQPRYRGAGAFSTDDAPMAIVGGLLAGCAGDLLDSGGKLSFLIKTNTLATPAVEFDDHDVQSAGTWDPMGGQTNLPNIIAGTFTDPSPNSLYQPAPFTSVSLPSEDGIERTAPLDFGVVENAPQSERLAKQTLQRMQYPGLFTAEYNLKAMAATVGSIVWQTYSPRGWVNKAFRVLKQKPSRSGRIALVLREEHEAIYSWEAEDSAGVQAAEPVRFDPRNTGPMLLARQAAETATWNKITGEGKPQDNATVGAPPGTPVGDRPAEDVVNELDQHTAQIAAAESSIVQAQGEIDDLFETYGSTAAAADSAAAAQAAEQGAAQHEANAELADQNAQAALANTQTARDAALNAQAAAENAELGSEAARDAAALSEQAAQAAEANAVQKAADAEGSATAAAGSATIADAASNDAETFAGIAEVNSISARLASALLFPERYVTGEDTHFTLGAGGSPQSRTPQPANATLAGFGPVYETPLVGSGQTGPVFSQIGVLPATAGLVYEIEAEVEVTQVSGTNAQLHARFQSLDSEFAGLSGASASLVVTAPGTYTVTVLVSDTADAAHNVKSWDPATVWLRPATYVSGGDGSITAQVRRLAVRDVTGAIQAAIAAEAAAISESNAAVSETNAGVSAIAAQEAEVNASASAASAAEAAQQALATSMPERYVTGSETNFTSAIPGDPTTVPTVGSNATLSGWGAVYQVSADQSAWAQKNLFSPVAGRIYEVEVEAECTAVNTAGGTPALQAAWWSLASGYTHFGGAVNTVNLTATGTFAVTLRVSDVPNAAKNIVGWNGAPVYLRPGGRLILNGGTATIQFKRLAVRDITSRIASEIAAEAAASHAQTAEAEANEAAASAQAAQTSETNAATHAGEAGTFSLASSQSAADAESARDEAIIAQNAAATSATNSGNSATAAAGSAQTATTKATEAEQSAVSAGASLFEARIHGTTQGLTGNAAFTSNRDGWFRTVDRSVALDNTNCDWVATELGRAGLIRTLSGQRLNIYGPSSPVQPDRQYRINAGIWSPSLVNNWGFACYDQTGAWISNVTAVVPAIPSVWLDFRSATRSLVDFPAGTVSIAPLLFLNMDANVNRVRVDYCYIEDVTESAASATSAASAAASEDAAGQSATAAQTAETNAETAASNAATSETNAATSETNAAGSAAAASSSEGLAATAKADAEAAATSAADSASTATAEASDAAQSAQAATSAKTAAETASGEALTYRNEAVSAKEDAESAEQSASASAGIAVTSANAAATRAATKGLTPNGTLDNGLDGFWRFATQVGPLSDYATYAAAELGRSGVALTPNGTQVNAYGTLASVQPGRRYVVRAGVWKVLEAQAQVGFAYYDSAKNFISNTTTPLSGAGSAWNDFTSPALLLSNMPANTAFVAPVALLNINSDPNRVRLDYLYLDDVTESAAAAGSASAAAASASTATTKADEASGYAATASTQAGLAASARNEAETQAGISEANAVVATAEAAAAQQSMTTAADIAASGVNKNGTFANYPGTTLPEHWTTNGSGTVSKAAGQISPNACRVTAPANTNMGIVQTVGGPTQQVAHAGQKWVAEVDVTVVAGSLAPAGLILQFRDSAGTLLVNRLIALDAIPDSSGAAPGAGAVGRTYRFVTPLQDAPANSHYIAIHGYSSYVSFGHVGVANTLDFHRLIARAANPAEIAAGVALPALQASVSTNTQALADLDTAFASVESEVQAQGVLVSEHTQAITQVEGDVQNMAGMWALAIDVNGRVVGRIKLDGTQDFSELEIMTNVFRLVSPTGGARTEFSDGHWRVYDANGVLRVRLGVWA